jgi:hypothetical protein
MTGAGNILGVDIGVKGALALLSPAGELLAVEDMPILRDGPSNRPNVSAPLLAEITYRWQASHVFVEYVAARPDQKQSAAGQTGPRSSPASRTMGEPRRR